MPNTYQLIQTITLGSSASSITFSSIPQTFTDLVLKLSLRNDTGTTYNNVYLTFNGTPTGTLYSDKSVYAVGTTTGSLGHNSANQMWLAVAPSSGNTANTFSNSECIIPNYAGSGYKSVLSEGISEANTTSNGYIYNNIMCGIWANTAAITSLVLTSDASSFVTNSSASLYGIKNS